MTACFSQTTYPKNLNDSLIVITKDQLKQINLVFIENDKLLLENQQYIEQNNNYKLLIDNYELSDSIKSEQISTLKYGLTESDGIIRTQSVEINNLYKKNKLFKGLTIGGFTISATLLILLLVK